MEREAMTNKKPPVDLEPLAEAAAQIAFIALIGFLAWAGLR